MARTPLVLLLLTALVGVRLALADAVELSGAEAVVWRAAQDQPSVFPLEALGSAVGHWLFGQSALAIRFVPVLVGVAVVGLAGAATGSGLAALAVATLPALSLFGLLAGPAPWLSLGFLAAWVGARDGRWLLVAAGCVVAGLAHGVGLVLPLAVLLARPLAPANEPSGRRSGRGLWMALVGAVACISLWVTATPGAAQRLLGDWAEGGQHPAENAFTIAILTGPVLLAGLALWWMGAHKGRLENRLSWWLSVPLVVATVGHLGDGAVAAAALTVAVTGLAVQPGRWRRVTAVGAGINLVATAVVMLHMVRPVAHMATDPRDTLAGGEVLAGSVEGWGIDTVYTDQPEDAALLRFHLGIDAGPLPTEPVTPSLYIRPWRAGVPIATDATGVPRSAPNTVTAAVDTPNPEGARIVARWQVYALGPGHP